jgi:hypothetical protein
MTLGSTRTGLRLAMPNSFSSSVLGVARSFRRLSGIVGLMNLRHWGLIPQLAPFLIASNLASGAECPPPHLHPARKARLPVGTWIFSTRRRTDNGDVLKEGESLRARSEKRERDESRPCQPFTSVQQSRFLHSKRGPMKLTTYAMQISGAEMFLIRPKPTI